MFIIFTYKYYNCEDLLKDLSPKIGTTHEMFVMKSNTLALHEEEITTHFNILTKQQLTILKHN